MSKKETPGKAYQVPPDGSLGLLAVGYRGLIAWREAQKKYREENPPTAKNDEQKKS